MVSVISPISQNFIESSLNSLVNDALTLPRSDVHDPGPRFIFSSRYRDLLANDRTGYARTANLGPLANVSPDSLGGKLSSNQTGTSKPTRVEMKQNPSVVRFVQPKRFVQDKTMGGTDFHFFSDENLRNLDVMTITIEGSTGNLDYRNGDPDSQIQALNRLHSFHNLLSLTEEGMLIKGSDRVMKNMMTFTITSLLFPAPFIFDGFVSKRMEFSEDAQDPFARRYSLEFIVTATPTSLASINAALANHDERALANLPTELAAPGTLAGLQQVLNSYSPSFP